MSGPILAKHIGVAGESGGGKTTLLRQMHAQHNGPSIYLTPKKEPRRKRMYNDPPRRIWKDRARYPHDVATARAWARKHPEMVQVIVDESQNAPTFRDGVQGPVYKMFHEDRDRKVKVVVATQNAMDWHSEALKYGPIQQVEYFVFVGKVKDWHVGFLNGNNMASILDHLPTRSFEYVVVDPAASLKGADKIVYRGETQRKYA